MSGFGSQLSVLDNLKKPFRTVPGCLPTKPFLPNGFGTDWQVTSGASRSKTVTVKLQVATLALFDAVHVTLVVPLGNANGPVICVLPALQTTTGAGRPEAATGNVKDAEQWPGSLVRTIGPGQEVKTGSGNVSMLKLRICRTGLLIGSYSR